MFVCTGTRGTPAGEACCIIGVGWAVRVFEGDKVLLGVGVAILPVGMLSGGVGNCSDMWSGGDVICCSGVVVAGGVGSSIMFSPGCIKSGGKYENLRPVGSLLAGLKKMELDLKLG